MPASDRIQRLLELVGFLQIGRPTTTVAMASHFGVSRRTIFRDLRVLQDAGVQVFYDEEQQAYRMPARWMRDQPEFSTEELLALYTLCSELGGRECGIALLEPARSAAVKLLNNLPERLTKTIGESASVFAIQLDGWDIDESYKRTFGTLTDAARKKRCIRIHYNDSDEERSRSTLLKPYGVVFEGRNWFVIGRSSVHRAIVHFNVHRILETVPLESRFKVPSRFDLHRYATKKISSSEYEYKTT